MMLRNLMVFGNRHPQFQERVRQLMFYDSIAGMAYSLKAEDVPMLLALKTDPNTPVPILRNLLDFRPDLGVRHIPR